MPRDMSSFIQSNSSFGIRVGTTHAQPDSRHLAIVVGCDLEIALADLLRAFLSYANNNYQESIARKDLFGQDRPWSNLTQQIKLCFHLGLVDKNERDDLQKMAKLRHAYAHGRHLGTLASEPTIVSLIDTCHAYIRHKDKFEVIDPPIRLTGIVCALRDYYVETLKRRAEILRRNTGALLAPINPGPGQAEW